MPNPIKVIIAVSQPTTIFIMADTFAAWQQRVTVQCPDNKTLMASGGGEGKRIAYWKYPVQSSGMYAFGIYIEHNDGSDWIPNNEVASGSFSAFSLHQTVVFSEDMADGDMNDCFVTMMWFSSGGDSR